MASLGSPVKSFMLHCISAALASSDMSGRACKILMEMKIWRDRLDHILESVGA